MDGPPNEAYSDDKQIKQSIEMKKILKITLTMLASAAIPFSCAKEEGIDPSLLYPNMLVTVKTAENGQQYLQLDEETTLLPVNIEKPLFDGKQIRAFANCTETDDPSGIFTKSVEVNWADSILTKKMVLSQGESDKALYGDAPVEIERHWATIVEDDYATICFSGLWGDATTHGINLVMGTDPEDPYTLVLRHNANGDTFAYGGGRLFSGFVAFDLRELPDTEGKIVELNIKYTSFRGEKVATFDYCTGRASSVVSQERLSLLRLPIE